MVFINKYLTAHPLYFIRLFPFVLLFILTACGGDDFASKPLKVTPNEHVVKSSVPNEPPIIILSPQTKHPKTVRKTKK